MASAVINGIVVTGTPQEIAQIIRSLTPPKLVTNGYSSPLDIPTTGYEDWRPYDWRHDPTLYANMTKAEAES